MLYCTTKHVVVDCLGQEHAVEQLRAIDEQPHVEARVIVEAPAHPAEALEVRRLEQFELASG
eukprot:14924803-Alexandrium_andersonii.AAC.1